MTNSLERVQDIISILKSPEWKKCQLFWNKCVDLSANQFKTLKFLLLGLSPSDCLLIVIISSNTFILSIYICYPVYFLRFLASVQLALDFGRSRNYTFVKVIYNALSCFCELLETTDYILAHTYTYIIYVWVVCEYNMNLGWKEQTKQVLCNATQTGQWFYSLAAKLGIPAFICSRHRKITKPRH